MTSALQPSKTMLIEYNMILYTHTGVQGRHQVKKRGVRSGHMWRARVYKGSPQWVQGQSHCWESPGGITPQSWKPLSFRMQNRRSKFPHSPYFVNRRNRKQKGKSEEIRKEEGKG